MAIHTSRIASSSTMPSVSKLPMQTPQAVTHPLTSKSTMGDAMQLKEHYNQLWQRQSNFRSYWEEIAPYFHPNQSDITNPYPFGGDVYTEHSINQSGVLATQLFAAGVYGYLANPGTRWFGIELEDEALQENKEAQQWLTKFTKKLYFQMERRHTRIDAALGAHFMNLGAFGTALTYIGYNPLHRCVYYESCHIRECVIAENVYGIVDTVFRKRLMTGRQIHSRWQVADKNIKDTDTDRYPVIQAVFPRRTFNPAATGILPVTERAFASYYFLEDPNIILEEGGYNLLPFMSSRWTVHGQEVYGRSPAMNALPHVRMLNEVEEEYYDALQKRVNPAWKAPNDSQFGRFPYHAGATLYYEDDPDEIQPIQTQSDPVSAGREIQRLEQRVYELMQVDKLQLPPPQDSPVSATEIQARLQEHQRLLGPQVAHLEQESLNHLLARTIEVLTDENRKLHPEFPIATETGRTELKYNYLGPLALAKRRTSSHAVANFYNTMQYAVINPEIARLFNIPVLADEVRREEGLSADAVKTISELQQGEQVAVDAQEQLDELGDTEQRSVIGKNTAKAAKDAEGVA